MTEHEMKAAAEPPLDCHVRRDIVPLLRARAARKWTDEANRSASLFGQAASEIERLRAELYVWRQMGRSLHDAGLRVVDVVPNVKIDGSD